MGDTSEVFDLYNFSEHKNIASNTKPENVTVVVCKNITKRIQVLKYISGIDTFNKIVYDIE